MKAAASSLSHSALTQARDQLASQAVCARLRKGKAKFMDVYIPAHCAVEGSQSRPSLEEQPRRRALRLHRAQCVELAPHDARLAMGDEAAVRRRRSVPRNR